MLKIFLNISLTILICTAWLCMIYAISMNESTYALYGTISCIIGLVICYVKDKYNYDQDEEGGKLNE